jgi:hypothetical protein
VARDFFSAGGALRAAVWHVCDHGGFRISIAPAQSIKSLCLAVRKYMKLRLDKPMNSREHVLADLRHEPVDRTPVCNPTSVATVALMDLADAPFPDANRVPELMARLGATSYTERVLTPSCSIPRPSLV